MSIVVFDFETGGVESRHPSIQLAAVAVDDAWNEIEAFELKIKFDPAQCEPEALRINHYEPALYESAYPPEKVFRDFCMFLDKHKSVEMVSKRTGRPYKVARLAAYNASFDKDRLWAMGAGQFIPAHPQALCIMQLAMWAVVCGTIKTDKLKLSSVAKAVGLPTDDAHDALADVRMAAGVARKLLAPPSMPTELFEMSLT